MAKKQHIFSLARMDFVQVYFPGVRGPIPELYSPGRPSYRPPGGGASLVCLRGKREEIRVRSYIVVVICSDDDAKHGIQPLPPRRPCARPHSGTQ